MLTGEGVKQILYSEIEDIGKEKIQADIASSIELSQQYIDKIMRKCIARLAYESNDNHNDDIDPAIGTLCEALLHFMLTTCTLPSERKVKAKNDAISHKNYSNIIIDINDFLNEIRDKSFRFVH